ncbi:MAG: DEAD/DEAH box helicase [Gammaproteobacteria bacterium]|nr:DEAD/DEAH box helicase [Gammaproteobacteria bacterium]
MTPLENRLVLHQFLCGEFGYDGLSAMLERLRDTPAGVNANGESFYFRSLFPDPAGTRIAPNRLAEYDAAIAALSLRLRMTPEQGRGWKPHQWLALLFAEHYLRLYFEDPEGLRAALNAAKRRETLTARMPDYAPDDLRTVAVQSATGSGKTLVMHAHILQYRRIADDAGKPPRNVILVTPNEQLSEQHERELLASNQPARIFSSEAGADLLRPVEIIDVNKLAEKQGVKRVAVRDFGENNLVLVDEGHLGASGKVWRERRAELAEGGFTFEYSATFNQIVGRDDGLRDAYGKSLLFDYPYRAFHADGYGKDYAIANLPQGAEDENSRIYLLGALLSFYRQCRIWREGRAGWTEFNVTPPLWVFLGKTVTGNTNADRATRSDVVLILDFLGWVLAHGAQVRPMLARLLAGGSGLTDQDGQDYFAGRFEGLEGTGASELYEDICETLFHGAGRLHVRYLTQGEGELHMRTADNEPFGVVNVGDSAALYRLLGESGNPDLALEREAGFTRRLFAEVDRTDSTVNIVIGARRFIAGWNSWRVSAMGLMHVGVGEGPEIIQMFGRGVRLKGWNMSLKRHRQSGADAPPDSGRLAELETLRIFGLKANYMQTFRQMLETDGMSTEREEIPLPVTWNVARKKLKIFRLRTGLEYNHSDDRPVLPGPDGSDMAELDLYSRLQVLESRGGKAGDDTQGLTVRLERRHTAFFNRARIYGRLLARKQQEGWHNLAIDRATVDALLDRDDWYQLRLPPERLEPTTFADLMKLEEVAVELIADYAGRFWRRRRRRWEYENLEVRTLDESDPNSIGEYTFSVGAGQEPLIEDIRALSNNLREGPFPSLGFGLLMRDEHAYKPLLYTAGRRVVAVRPVLLNEDEMRVVERLANLAKSGDSCLKGRELFLIRNLSRGRGVSFFDDHSYYPDFIVWLAKGRDQHILFLDPKGLGRFSHNERRKVGLHTAIKEVEARVRLQDAKLRLHAYVLSVTAPDKIGSDDPRSREEWERRGVYFLHDNTWPERLLGHALSAASSEH